MRNRKPLCLCSARPSQPVIFRSRNRVREILTELGKDVKEYQKETKLRRLFRMQAAGLIN